MEKVPQQNPENIPSTEENNKLLGLHIQLALDIEQNFKLYSWRIINQEVYIARNNDLIAFHNSQFKTK